MSQWWRLLDVLKLWYQMQPPFRPALPRRLSSSPPILPPLSPPSSSPSSAAATPPEPFLPTLPCSLSSTPSLPPLSSSSAATQHTTAVSQPTVPRQPTAGAQTFPSDSSKQRPEQRRNLPHHAARSPLKDPSALATEPPSRAP
ncbi:hypothetical protein BC826DRAFT_1106006 [Russula brevipes]|nr:hypothetical protein BC826DRAFT_1105995 [Russula brevipes]KAI0291487.1 hypothetical protein BC826DRAFT_1106006 [Russula brevipes]